LAAPIIEKLDRMEINWSKQRVQFYGQANPSDLAMGEDYKSLEKRAWKDGLSYIAKKARDLHIAAFEPLEFSPKSLAASADAAAQQVTQSTMSINTIFYGNGGVQVVLENSLVKIFDSANLRFSQKEANVSGSTQYSGFVISLDQSTPARAFYQIIDEDSKILFDYRFIAEDAYKKNLMGRWYKNPTPSEVLESAGVQPVTIAAQVVREGVYRVSRVEWDQMVYGHKGLLAAGMLMIAVP
jgi:hypothetical protein